MKLIPQKKSKMLGYPTAVGHTRIVKISESKKESPTVKTFTFQDNPCAKAEPGQFVMVWIPGVDEIPLSLSTITRDGLTSITVAQVGEATKALHQREPGDALGIRGPIGRGFTPARGKVLIVGGGTGMAPLKPLTERLRELPTQLTFLLGAKTKDELLFLDRIDRMLSKVSGELVVTTEDGSYGLRGVITDQVERKLAKARFDMIYTCGPEQMMREVFFLAERYETPVQACLERVIRCGIGLCGSCVIGKVRVCRDGPVLTSEQLRTVAEEFGRFKLDFHGRRVTV